MANLMDDVIAYYTEVGLVTGLGVDAFSDTMPDKPDTCLSVFEYEGLPQPDHTDIATRNLQICNRAKSASTARANSLAFYAAIVPQEQRQDLTDERWSLVEPKQTPFKLRVDGEGRTYYVFNLEMVTKVDSN